MNKAEKVLDWVIVLITIIFMVLGAKKMSGQVTIRTKVFLSGVYDHTTGQMRTTLADSGLLPLSQPYTLPPYSFTKIGLSACDSVDSNTVDWIWIAVRDKNNRANVVCSGAATLDKYGEAVILMDIVPDYYFVSVHHRNHLAVMTDDSIYLDSTSVGFTDIPLWSKPGQQPCRIIDNKQMLYAGDVNGDKIVKYNGVYMNDKQALFDFNGTTSVHHVYRREDLNLDGVVDYNTDRYHILYTVGVTTPNNIVTAQIH